MVKLLRFKLMLLMAMVLMGAGNVWGAETIYNFETIPTTGWSTSGSSQTINSISWTYSSSTYISCSSGKIQIGSKNKPQTSAWTIQTPVSSFGSGKAIKAVSITAYTTTASATYDISVGGSSVKSGSLSTSSSIYSATGLNVTSGNIIITMQGSSTSKAMYLSNISVTYDDASSDPVISASNVDINYDATVGEFAYSISNPVESNTLSASVTAGDTWLSNATVDAVNGKVTFTTTENEDEDNARVGTIHLVYGSNLATKDVTVTQAKAPKKYTVTIETPEGGTLVVKNGDAPVASGTKLPAGTELTIEVTADENYKYKNWQYKKGTGSWVTKTANYTYTMDADDVSFKAVFDATYPVNWSVNGTVVSTTRFAEGESITFPDDPAEIDGRVFVGWVTDAITGTTDDTPTFLTSPTMGTSSLTYYAVFAEAVASGDPVETKTQTLQYDTWTYSGTTTDKTSYRLFGSDSYIESASFDLSKLSKVKVYAGTFGTLDSSEKKVSVKAGSADWGSATLSTNNATTENVISSEVALSGNGKIRILPGGGDGSSSGIRISKVEVYTMEPTYSYSNYCTTVATDTRTAVNMTSFTTTETTLVKGNTTATSVANDQAGWTAAYTYASDNTEVATVAADGVITAVAKGTAKITATLNVDKDDAIYKAGDTKSKSIDIIVENPKHTVKFYNNGEEITASAADVEEEDDIVFPAAPSVFGFDFVGWATTEIDGSVAEAPTTVTAATMGDTDVNYYAVYGDVQRQDVTATFDASDISNLTASGLQWTDKTTGIVLSLSAGQRYTSGTPNTFTVTKGTSNYFEVAVEGKLKNIVTTISGADYKIGNTNSGNLSTNGTTQSISFSNDVASVKCYSTSGYQIRATKIVVDAEYCRVAGYVTTVPTSINVTISDAGYRTYCSGKALDFTSVSDLDAYTASVSGEVVTFTKVTGAVPANTGLLMKGKSATIPYATSAPTAVSNAFVGVLAATEVPANSVFVLMNGAEGVGFYKNANAFTVGANTAYLPASVVAGARIFIGFDDDGEEATGINGVKEMKENRAIYNLRGMRVTTPSKGLYIIGGKKVVIK